MATKRKAQVTRNTTTVGASRATPRNVVETARAKKKKAALPVKRFEAARAIAEPAPTKVPHSHPLVVRLREICMALPEVNERPSHGEPTWFAGKGRSFATLDNHHHGAPHLSVWLPQPLGVQQALLEADSRRFFRPPYVGVSGWIGVVLDAQPNWTLVASLVRDAYLHVATQKLIKQLKEREQR